MESLCAWQLNLSSPCLVDVYVINDIYWYLREPERFLRSKIISNKRRQLMGALFGARRGSSSPRVKRGEVWEHCNEVQSVSGEKSSFYALFLRAKTTPAHRTYLSLLKRATDLTFLSTVCWIIGIAFVVAHIPFKPVFSPSGPTTVPPLVALPSLRRRRVASPVDSAWS